MTAVAIIKKFLPGQQHLAEQIVSRLREAGYAIVPVEPNQTMSADGGIAIENAMFQEGKELIFDVADDCYKAMVAAAPDVG